MLCFKSISIVLDHLQKNVTNVSMMMQENSFAFVTKRKKHDCEKSLVLDLTSLPLLFLSNN